MYDILVVPVDKPATTPVPTTTSATPGKALDHVPPAVVEIKGVVAPTHTALLPVIAAGVAFIVTTTFVLHAPAVIYVTLAVPADTPVSNPVVNPTLALPGNALTHVPPEISPVRVAVSPAHNIIVPLIVLGVPFTVTSTTLLQPFDMV
jgi:hypothetical protein